MRLVVIANREIDRALVLGPYVRDRLQLAHLAVAADDLAGQLVFGDANRGCLLLELLRIRERIDLRIRDHDLARGRPYLRCEVGAKLAEPPSARASIPRDELGIDRREQARTRRAEHLLC